MPDLDRGMPSNWYQVLCFEHKFWAFTKPPWIWEWQDHQVSP